MISDDAPFHVRRWMGESPSGRDSWLVQASLLVLPAPAMPGTGSRHAWLERCSAARMPPIVPGRCSWHRPGPKEAREQGVVGFGARLPRSRPRRLRSAAVGLTAGAFTRSGGRQSPSPRATAALQANPESWEARGPWSEGVACWVRSSCHARGSVDLGWAVEQCQVHIKRANGAEQGERSSNGTARSGRRAIVEPLARGRSGASLSSLPVV